MVKSYTLNENLVTNENGRIHLKDLEQNLIFYASYDVNIEADFSYGDSIPIVSNSNTGLITSTGLIPFGKALLLGDTTNILYKKENFINLTNEGSISFWLKNYQLRNTAKDVTIFEFVDTNDINNLNNNNGKIKLVYEIGDSNFHFIMYGDTGSGLINTTIPNLIPSIISENFYHIEINWNSSLAQIFVNGNQSNLIPTGFTRNVYGALILHGNNNITIDDLVIRNKYNNLTNFTASTNAFSKYPIGNFGQEISLGDSFEKDKIIRFDIEGDTSLKLILKHGDTYYNIINNEWQVINNPIYENSDTIYEFKNIISRFPFIKTKEVKIKVFFPSNGLKQIYLDDIEIIKDLTNTLNTSNYKDVIRYLRSKLGDPTIPVELTDEQLSDCIDDSIYWYGRFKNTKEEMEIFDLDGSWKDGWELPDNVKEENIIDIFINPRFPFGYYTGRNDIISNIYAQYIFSTPGSRSLSSGIADYRITLSAIQDYAILLGTQVKWLIVGRKLKIWPEPSEESYNIGIKYTSDVVAQDVLKDNLFREIALAEAKIVLGTIRSTFVGGIPGGQDVIQLNGESLLQEGKQEKERLLERLRKTQEPLFLSWF